MCGNVAPGGATNTAGGRYEPGTITSPFLENHMNKNGTVRKIVHRDSVDGQFVKQQYAEQHPRTTERQHVYVPAPKPPKK